MPQKYAIYFCPNFFVFYIQVILFKIKNSIAYKLGALKTYNIRGEETIEIKIIQKAEHY